MKKAYGQMNAHSVGIIMKEIVRRAIEEIWKNRAQFESTEKTSYKKERDFFTSADIAAQKIYVKKLRECFPTFGIIGEESNLSIPCTEVGVNIYFTVDPLDGTKAFMRRQSHGIGTMLSLVCDGVVIAAVVGDIMTGEIYYFRPESNRVHRLNLGDDRYEVLTIDTKRSLADQYILLREDPRSHSKSVQRMTQGLSKGGLFKNIEVAGGSIGTHMARLWKSEVGAVLLQAGIQTPWDLTPVLGISNQLGFVWVKIDPKSHGWSTKSVLPSTRLTTTDTEMLIIHQSRLGELGKWITQK